MVIGNTSNEALIAAFREAQAKRNEISKENRERILKYNEEGDDISFNDIITKILDDYERLNHRSFFVRTPVPSNINTF